MSGTGGSTAFLIGAGRSGTTLLYKLLCLHPAVGYISNYDERLPSAMAGLVARMASRGVDVKLQAWFDHGGNAYFVRRPWLKRFLPTPVEGEVVYRSCGIPLFPEPGYIPPDHVCERLRTRFGRIRRACGAGLLLSKRTANNRRIPMLEASFPDARYIHMIRDGREVADSLTRVEWWDRHILWWDGRTAAQAEKDGAPRLALAARNWVRELAEIHQGLATVSPDRVLELRYEDLLVRPVDVLARILRFLGLEPDESYARAICRLQLRYRPGAWSARWSARQLEDVMREVGPMLGELGYLQREGA